MREVRNSYTCSCIFILTAEYLSLPSSPQKKQNLLSFPTVLVPFLFVKITIWMHCNSSLQLGVFIILIQHSVVEKVIKLCLRRFRLNSKSFTELSFFLISYVTFTQVLKLQFTKANNTDKTPPKPSNNVLYRLLQMLCKI